MNLKGCTVARVRVASSAEWAFLAMSKCLDCLFPRANLKPLIGCEFEGMGS